MNYPNHVGTFFENSFQIGELFPHIVHGWNVYFRSARHVHVIGFNGICHEFGSSTRGGVMKELERTLDKRHITDPPVSGNARLKPRSPKKFSRPRAKCLISRPLVHQVLLRILVREADWRHRLEPGVLSDLCAFPCARNARDTGRRLMQGPFACSCSLSLRTGDKGLR